MKQFICPNYKNGCEFTGTLSEVKKHLKNGCSYERVHTSTYYESKDDNFFSTLLTAYIIHDALSHESQGGGLEDFHGGGGSFGGGGASGSWDSDSSSSSDSSSFDSGGDYSGGGCDVGGGDSGGGSFD